MSIVYELDDDDVVDRGRVNVGDPAGDELAAAERTSTGGGAGEPETRGGSGVCPMGVSAADGPGGGMADRGTRKVAAEGLAVTDGIGVGRR